MGDKERPRTNANLDAMPYGALVVDRRGDEWVRVDIGLRQGLPEPTGVMGWAGVEIHPQVIVDSGTLVFMNGPIRLSPNEKDSDADHDELVDAPLGSRAEAGCMTWHKTAVDHWETDVDFGVPCNSAQLISEYWPVTLTSTGLGGS